MENALSSQFGARAWESWGAIGGQLVIMKKSYISLQCVTEAGN